MYVTNITWYSRQEVQKNNSYTDALLNPANDIHMEFMHIFTLFLFYLFLVYYRRCKIKKNLFDKIREMKRSPEKMKDEKKCKIRVRKILERILVIFNIIYFIKIKIIIIFLFFFI